jgi:tol-pal system protein YbgF
MKSKIRTLFGVCLLSTVALSLPASAQSAAELNVRMMQLEDQIRQLVGQVEQLTYEVQQLKRSAAIQRPQRKATAENAPLAGDQGGIQASQLPQVAKRQPQNQDIEQIEDPPGEIVTTVIDENGNEQQITLQRGEQPRILGQLKGTSEGDGGFQGQVLVAPGGQPVVQAEQVAIQQEEPLDTPEKLYEQAYENLLRRQFTPAEEGFKGFLSRYRDHSLAGNAQYWLGETYYVQGDYKAAAKSFLAGYQEFPKSRKAADSLLKLGLSLNRLGQKEQACAAYSAVGEKFPKATEARKRAQNELKGC